MSRLAQIHQRLQAIPEETMSLTRKLAELFAEQVALAEELNQHHSNFDLVRISHSKRLLGISTSQIREYERRGLELHRRGRRQTFVSKLELAEFLKQK